MSQQMLHFTSGATGLGSIGISAVEAAGLEPLIIGHSRSTRILSTQALEKLPLRTESKYVEFAASCACKRSSSSAAIPLGTTTTPIGSPTMRSPALTTTPPQQIG